MIPEPSTVLVTGVGRRIGIGHAVATTLREAGWSVATSGWRGYDDRMSWGADAAPLADFETDFADPDAPAALVAAVTENVGPLRALVLCHCESVDSSIHDTTVASFDRHMAVNARSIWLCIKAFAEQFPPNLAGLGRVVAFTSDHVVHNLPYGASKGALDRIVLAAAGELAPNGITANVINPGATDTGWMDPEVTNVVLQRNLQPRVGVPHDAANLVRFLLSPDGGWINGQTLYSDGGLRH